MKRYFRQLVLLKLVLLSLTAAALIGPMQGLLERMSLVSAWLSMFLIAAALLVGPKMVLAGQGPAINSLVRRDLGIWAALTGLLHFVLGTSFSMAPDYIGRFVTGEVAESQFFWGSIFGTVAGLLALLLLVISNNKSLAALGPVRWKRLQRSAYWLFALVVAHGVLFQQLESRGLFLIALAALTLLVFAAQSTAFIRHRQRASVFARK